MDELKSPEASVVTCIASQDSVNVHEACWYDGGHTYIHTYIHSARAIANERVSRGMKHKG